MEETFNFAVLNGAIPLEQPHHIEDEKGTLTIAKIGTPFGDVVHTLINRSKYGGIFLPDFIENKINLRFLVRIE